MKSLLVGLSATALVGCAGVSVSPSELRPVEARGIELNTPVRWKYDSGLFWGHWEYQLVAGTYTAALEDDSGTYYWGPKPTCLYQTAVAKSDPPMGSSLRCAIFVPHKTGDLPVVFFVTGTVLKQHAFNPDGTPIIEQVDYGPSTATPSPDTTAYVSSVVANSVPATATPIQAGLGGGIAAGIVAVMSKTESGKLVAFDKQPPRGWLQAATR